MGRAGEMARLGEALELAFAGRGAVALLAGEPGIGKTTVARALAHDAESRGAATVWGVGWSGDAAPAYWIWVQVARGLLRRPGGAELLTGLGPNAAWLAEIVPELRAGAPEPPPGGPDAGRFRVYDALAELLRLAARDAPLLVVLDDLQWADEASLLALTFVARALPDAGVTLLGTYRATELAHDEGGASGLTDLVGWSDRIELHGLEPADVRRLIESLGRADPPDGVVERLHEVTGGNPLFVSALLTMLEAEGRLGDVSEVSALPLPEGVREAISHRLSPLSPATREALVVGSVIGLEFHVDTLGRAAGIPHGTVAEHLDAAVHHGLVHPVAEGSDRYRFSHGLVQATLYDVLAQSRRAELHRAVGEAIEGRYADDELDARVNELAHHFLEAGDDRAIPYARRAGDRAMRQFAYDQAALFFERALDVLPPGHPEDRIALLQCLGEAQTRAGDIEAARGALLAAAESARRHDDAEALARAALACGIWGLSFGVDEELVRLLEEAIEVLDGPTATPACWLA